MNITYYVQVRVDIMSYSTYRITKDSSILDTAIQELIEDGYEPYDIKIDVNVVS